MWGSPLGRVSERKGLEVGEGRSPRPSASAAGVVVPGGWQGDAWRVGGALRPLGGGGAPWGRPRDVTELQWPAAVSAEEEVAGAESSGRGLEAMSPCPLCPAGLEQYFRPRGRDSLTALQTSLHVMNLVQDTKLCLKYRQ